MPRAQSCADKANDAHPFTLTGPDLMQVQEGPVRWVGDKIATQVVSFLMHITHTVRVVLCHSSLRSELDLPCFLSLSSAE